jgi:uncharacterized protein DUF6602
MPESKPFNIDKLFEGSLRRLRTEAEYFSRLTDHDPELGRLNETHLFNLLRAYLPPKIGIGTGFIACGGDDPDQSQQCDIILYDALNNSPLYRSDVWSIYPIEMVYGIIEVKTTLNKRELEDVFTKCARIRKMAKLSQNKGNKAYIRQVNPAPKLSARHYKYMSDLPPRFFVFAYNGWKTAAALEKNFKTVSSLYKKAHIHGICNLYEGGSLFVRHLASGKGEGRFSKVSENGFRYFLMNLPTILDSMLPTHRLGLGFDQIYLNHYALAIE